MIEATKPERVISAYRHRDYWTQWANKGKEARQFVQVRLGKVSHCARIIDAWDTSDGVEMWKLALLFPNPGQAHVRASMVRQCSGVDGFCSCANEAGAPRQLAQRGAAGAGLEDVRCQ